MKKSLSIKIFGEQGTGKSCVAVLIKQMLEQHGLEPTLIDDIDQDPVENLKNAEKNMPYLKEHVSVEIQTLQVRPFPGAQPLR